MKKNELVNKWIKRHENIEASDIKSGSNNDVLFWAYEKLDYLCRHEPKFAWEIVIEILKKNPSEFVLSNLAAGPLEDLLSSHGDLLINQVENEAKVNKQFKDLLGGVWQNNMSSYIWERVQKAADS